MRSLREMGMDTDAGGRMVVGAWCAAPAQSAGRGSSAGAVSHGAEPVEHWNHVMYMVDRKDWIKKFPLVMMVFT